MCGFTAMMSIEGITIQMPVARVLSSQRGWQVLRLFFAAFLLVALATVPTIGVGLLDN